MAEQPAAEPGAEVNLDAVHTVEASVRCPLVRRTTSARARLHAHEYVAGIRPDRPLMRRACRYDGHVRVSAVEPH
jgi:hypothetical protein